MDLGRGRIWGDWWFLDRGNLWFGGDISSRREVGCCYNASPYGQHTQVNTSVRLSIQYFLVLIFKNLYVLCFQIYVYYKRNTDGLWLHLGSMSEKDFWPARAMINPQTYFFKMWWFIQCIYILRIYLLVFDSLIAQHW